MIKNYDDFKFELLLESLLTESIVEYSEKFIDLVKQIKRNRIAKEILNLKKNKTDANFTHNYIDIGKAKDEVSFTADRKAREIFGREVVVPKYRVVRDGRYLTHSNGNNGVFDRLGYKKPTGEPWDPHPGEVGIIKAETQSSRSDNIYVWFVGNSGRETVINKNALVTEDERINKIWTTYRNNIKIGRIVRSLLNAAKIEFTDKEIEDFVNSYKSAYDILSDAFLKLSLVTGYEISDWYHGDKYSSDESTLGSSCMAFVDSDYFDIYCRNKNCSMLILFSDDGTITGGKYKSSKIKGRALVWKTKSGEIFMDRIYTNDDSDIELFKKYAFQNGWWCKIQQNSGNFFATTNGTITKEADFEVELEYSRFDEYPYVDSLSYINFDKKLLGNKPTTIDPQAELRDTDGHYQEIEGSESPDDTGYLEDDDDGY